MFSFHGRSNVALKEQKWSSDCTCGDDEESYVQTQVKEYTRKVFASQHGGQSIVVTFMIREFSIQWAKRVSKEENGPWVTEHGLH